MKKIQEYFGVSFAAPMSSGTAAIHVALGSLQLPPRSDAITSPITDVGSLVEILYQNMVHMIKGVKNAYEGVTDDD